MKQFDHFPVLDGMPEEERVVHEIARERWIRGGCRFDYMSHLRTARQIVAVCKRLGVDPRTILPALVVDPPPYTPPRASKGPEFVCFWLGVGMLVAWVVMHLTM